MSAFSVFLFLNRVGLEKKHKTQGVFCIFKRYPYSIKVYHHNSKPNLPFRPQNTYKIVLGTLPTLTKHVFGTTFRLHRHSFYSPRTSFTGTRCLLPRFEITILYNKTVLGTLPTLTKHVFGTSRNTQTAHADNHQRHLPTQPHNQNTLDDIHKLGTLYLY